MPSPTQTTPALRRWTLIAVASATAILMLDIAVVATALSDLSDDLDTGLHGLKWIIDAYTLALAGAVLTAGSLADRLGRRRVFIVGISVFTTASLASAVAPSVDVLIAARAVQGIGAAAMFAVSLALLADVFPAGRERASAIAVYGATIGASFAAGPLVGGALTSALGWRWVFLINVPIGLWTLFIAVRHLRESRDPVARRVDLPGQITLVVALGALVFGLLNGPDTGWDDPVNIVALGVAVAAGLAFVLIERRVSEPMVPFAMFSSPPFRLAQVTAVVISGGLYAILAYLMIYLQAVVGLSAVEAGLTLVPATLINLVVAGGSAGLAGRVAPRTIIVAGLSFAAAGLVLMTVADVQSSWWALLPGLSLANVGAGLINPAISALTLDVPAHRSGLASGIHDTARQAGMAVGVAALGALIPVGAGVGIGDADAFVEGLHDALWVGAAITAAGAGAALFLVREPRKASLAMEGA